VSNIVMQFLNFMKPTDKELEKLAFNECDLRNSDKYLPICIGKIFTVNIIFFVLLIYTPVILVKMVKAILLSLLQLIKSTFEGRT
jgi:hypothetical protein